jgi:hypothetical protein
VRARGISLTEAPFSLTSQGPQTVDPELKKMLSE